MSISIHFKCRMCGAEELEAEVVIDSAPISGCYSGPPEYCYPGEGAEWHVEADVACSTCGTLHDSEWLSEHLNSEVQERASEPPEP